MIENHVLDDIPAYSLGALSKPDRQRVESHLAGCQQCRDELSSYQKIVENLPASVNQYPLPAGLRASILNKVEQSQGKTNSSFKEIFSLWLRPFSTPLWGGISLAVILILSVSNLLFWQQSRSVVQPKSEFHLVQMAAANAASDAGGVIVISGDGNFGTLIVDGLPALDEAGQYQLWLIKEGKRTSGGVFSVLDSGYGVLIVNSPMPLSGYENFGVTVEPFGGSPGPTGQKVLGGNI